MTNDKHKWVTDYSFDTPQYKSNNWSKCEWCGAKRLLEFMTGWPSWYIYFTREGSYGPQEGRIVPVCSGDPQLNLSLL